MRRRFAALLILAACPLLAQTETVVGGVVADSSIAAPVAVWNRTTSQGDSTTFVLNGWTLSWEGTRRATPRSRRVTSVAVTPLHAHSSNRLYAAGQRDRAAEFDDASLEATYGRVDLAGERWTSD